MGGYIGTTLLHRQRNTGVFRPLILRGNSMRFRIIGPAVLVAAALTGMVAMAEDVDSYLWLEDVHGAKPLQLLKALFRSLAQGLNGISILRVRLPLYPGQGDALQL